MAAVLSENLDKQCRSAPRALNQRVCVQFDPQHCARCPARAAAPQHAQRTALSCAADRLGGSPGDERTGGIWYYSALAMRPLENYERGPGSCCASGQPAHERHPLVPA